MYRPKCVARWNKSALRYCSETTLTGESWFYINTPLGIEPGCLMTGSKRLDHWTPGTVCECSEIAGSPQGSPPAAKYVVVKPEGRPVASMKKDWRAMWDQVGLSHCQHDGLVTVRDEARLRRGHNDWSHWGHQCSETTLTGESLFPISTPPRDWTRVLHDGKQMGEPLDQWNSVWMQWDCRLSTGLPPSSRVCGCEAQRKTCSEHEKGLKSCVRSSGIITLPAWQSSDCSGWSPPQTRPQWSITIGVTNVARQR